MDLQRDETGDWWVAHVPIPELARIDPAGEPREVLCEEEDEAAARDAIQRVLEAMSTLVPVALQAVLDDAAEIRHDPAIADAYGDLLDELLPEMTDVDELIPRLSYPVVYCSAGPDGAVGAGLGFEATWDVEHGTCAVLTLTDGRVEVYEAGGPMASLSPFH